MSKPNVHYFINPAGRWLLPKLGINNLETNSLIIASYTKFPMVVWMELLHGRSI